VNGRLTELNGPIGDLITPEDDFLPLTPEELACTKSGSYRHLADALSFLSCVAKRPCVLGTRPLHRPRYRQLEPPS
jgi:hypothetical protein